MASSARDRGGHSTRAKLSLHPHVSTRHPTHSMCAYKQSLPRNVVVYVGAWRITSRPRLRRLPGHGRYEVPLNITSSIGTHEDTVDARSQNTLDKRRRRGKKSCDKAMCVGTLLCALLPREFFSARGAACDSARCRVRCCCCAR
jgi:hypothetical protein